MARPWRARRRSPDARRGQRPPARPRDISPSAIDRWFWRETAAARVFLALRQVCLASADPSLRPLGEIALVPQAIIHGPEVPDRRD